MLKSPSLNALPGTVSSKYSWAKGVPLLASGTVEFSPGVNVLFGPNGSGKSTIVGACAFLMAAEQGGVSTVTKKWVDDMFGFSGEDVPSCVLEHDGQPVMYIDSRKEVGVMTGGIDDDFFMKGMESILSRSRSTGELSLTKLDKVLRAVFPEKEKKPSRKKERFSRKGFQEDVGFPKEISWKMTKGSVNDVWKDRLERAERVLAGSEAKGRRTLLLDEPDSGFSLPWQDWFWNDMMLRKEMSEFQVIVATHSPFALGVKGAHVIETHEGYVAACRRMLKTLGESCA